MNSKINFSKIGFDYGLKPHLMLIGDPEFAVLFKKAKCIALQYFFKEDEKGVKIPDTLAFVFENEKPADDFFGILIDWIEKSNGNTDAVALDFVETNEGGYALGITPDMELFIDRIVPKTHKAKVSPVAVLSTQFKEIPVLGENYENFKNNLKNADEVKVSYAIVKGGKFVNEGKRSFTKKNFNFYKEDLIPENSSMMSYYAVKNKSGFVNKSEHNRNRPDDSDLRNRRVSEMKSYLPLTFNRIKNKWLEENIQKLEEEYENTQILQAICNLTIFERIKLAQDVRDDFTGHGYPNNILDYLLFTFESFDSYYPPDDFYSQERIICQIENDQNELAQYFNKP